jgi:HEAT repeat protein
MALKSIEETLRDLSSADDMVVIGTLNELYGKGIPAGLPVEAVLARLSHANWKVRAGAANCLGRMSQPMGAVMSGLMKALHDPSASVRTNAVVALGVTVGYCGPEARAAAVEVLTQATHDPAPSTQAAAWMALKNLGKVKELDPDYLTWLRRKVVKRLPKPETVKKYTAGLRDADPQKRITAMHRLSDVVCARQAELSALVTPCVPDLVALLEDPSWKVRAWAARLLGRIGPEADTALPHLVQAVQDRAVQVRSSAAFAIGLLGDGAKSAVPALEKALHDPARWARNAAHMALRSIAHADDITGTQVNEDDELISYPIDDEALGIHYYVMGFVSKRPWHKKSALLARSKEYTFEQLQAMVEETPQDYRLRVMLAERMENVEEKIEYIRKNIPESNVDGFEAGQEWRKAWRRLFDECPSFTLTGIDSLRDYAVPEWLQKELEPGGPDSVYESTCVVSDFLDVLDNERRGFFGGALDGHVVRGFDRIFRLTYRHFLCQEGATLTLYHSRDETFLVPAVQMTLAEGATLDGVLTKVRESSPEVFQELSAFLWKDPGRGENVSLYRLYVIGDSDYGTDHFAFGRAVVHNDLSVTPLDLVKAKATLIYRDIGSHFLRHTEP